MTFVTILLVLFGAQAPDSTHLESLDLAVQTYWDSLVARDKASALKFVYPDDLNNFLNRKDMGVRAWTLGEKKVVSESEVNVIVQLERTISGNSFSTPFSETWQKTDEGWKVRIDSLKDAYERATSAFSGSTPSLPSGFSWSPAQLRIYQIAQPKKGNMVLRNGTDEPILIRSFEVDGELFEVLSLPSRVNPKSTARLVVAYVGTATEENQESSATLRVEEAGQLKEYSVPVIYNYADDVTRWLSQKAPKQMANPPGLPPQGPPVPPPSR